MTINIAIENPNIVWDYSHLTYLKNVTWDIIEKNLSQSWDYYYLSSSNIINNEAILKYPKLPWCPHRLSENSSITLSKDFLDSLYYRQNQNDTYDYKSTTLEYEDYKDYDCDKY